jgi:hypothetical protein
MRHTVLAALPVAVIAAIAGCVTINIYFPAAAAEKAADTIIEEVWQLKERESTPGDTKGAPAPASKESR